MDKTPAPSLLPILRSRQQGDILALLLGDPGLELSLTEIARQTGAPHPSVFREIERADQAGLVTSRKVGARVAGDKWSRDTNGSGYARILLARGSPARRGFPCRPS